MSASDRFWAKADRSKGPDACWPWMGHRNAAGYGSFALAPGTHGHHEPIGAHRAAVILSRGPLPAGRVVVRHKCDNPPCVNPAHLELGTYVDNMRDMVERGRSSAAKVRKKLTPDDVLAIRADLTRPPGHVANEYGVSRTMIRKIRAGIVWKQVA